MFTRLHRLNNIIHGGQYLAANWQGLWRDWTFTEQCYVLPFWSGLPTCETNDKCFNLWYRTSICRSPFSNSISRWDHLRQMQQLMRYVMRQRFHFNIQLQVRRLACKLCIRTIMWNIHFWWLLLYERLSCFQDQICVLPWNYSTTILHRHNIGSLFYLFPFALLLKLFSVK
jgi:hypothetical protein